MRRLFKLLQCICVLLMTFIPAHASSILELEPSKPIQQLEQISWHMAQQITHCELRFGQALNNIGISYQNVANRGLERKIEQRCLCIMKNKLERQFRRIDSILLNYPEWRGRKLTVKGQKKTLSISLSQFDQFREKLENCHHKLIH